MREGFENASSEFDVEYLKPTFKLLIGVPGKSNAFAISKRLGIPEEILDKANTFISQDTMNIEELLKSIYDMKLDIERKQAEISHELKEASTLKVNLEKDYSALEEKMESDLADAKIKARQVFLDAKQEADEIIREMNEILEKGSKANLKGLNDLRNELNTRIKLHAPKAADKIHESIHESEIKIGMPVFVSTLKSHGVVLSLPNKSKEVMVQIGSMKTSVNIKDLEYSQESSAPAQTAIQHSGTNLKAKAISSEINVIGFNVDEATFVIDKFLDDAVLAKLNTIRIVHGKGTGKLREGIQVFLKKHPHVKSYRIGTYGEGEMGVTVVELK